MRFTLRLKDHESMQTVSLQMELGQEFGSMFRRQIGNSAVDDMLAMLRQQIQR